MKRLRLRLRLGLGVPVALVEAGSIPFRLTALPHWMRVWREAELGGLDIDLASRRTPAWLERREQWRSMVRGRLLRPQEDRLPEGWSAATSNRRIADASSDRRQDEEGSDRRQDTAAGTTRRWGGR